MDNSSQTVSQIRQKLETIKKQISDIESLIDTLEPHQKDGNQSKTPGIKILIVDDEEDIRNLLNQVVERMGHIPIVARRGKEALRLLEQESIQLMLTDIDMPGGTGLDLLKALKKRKLDVPSIVISGNVTPIVANELVLHGVKSMIVKPFTLERVMQEIEKVIKGEYSLIETLGQEL